jgi:hypothetical protein
MSEHFEHRDDADADSRFWIGLIFLVALGLLIFIGLIAGFAVFHKRIAMEQRDIAVQAELEAQQELERMDEKIASDISALSQGLESFKLKFAMDYVPSRIRLCKNRRDYNLKNQLDSDSFAYLNRLWPRLDWSQPIDWSGGAKGFVSAELEGDQCLIFFLGGIPKIVMDRHECTGFSTNPRFPAQPGGERVNFFELDSRRLVLLHDNPFFSYRDVYGVKPYAYFSSYRTKSGYNRYHALLGKSDCDLLGIWPYAEALTPFPRYLNPESYQIISAGWDCKFGPGTELPSGQTWTPATANLIAPEGRDDRANFYDRALGVAR